MIQRAFAAALLSLCCLSRALADPTPAAFSAPAPAPTQASASAQTPASGSTSAQAPALNSGVVPNSSVAISVTNTPSTQKPFTPSWGPLHISGIEAAVVGVQALDAIETSNCIRTGYCRETNPTVRPFSRGGPVEILSAFIAADLVRHFAFRHASVGAQNLLMILQGSMNVTGIMQSHAAIQQINAATGK